MPAMPTTIPTSALTSRTLLRRVGELSSERQLRVVGGGSANHHGVADNAAGVVALNSYLSRAGRRAGGGRPPCTGQTSSGLYVPASQPGAWARCTADRRLGGALATKRSRCRAAGWVATRRHHQDRAAAVPGRRGPALTALPERRLRAQVGGVGGIAVGQTSGARGSPSRSARAGTARAQDTHDRARRQNAFDTVLAFQRGPGGARHADRVMSPRLDRVRPGPQETPRHTTTGGRSVVRHRHQGQGQMVGFLPRG